MKYNEEIKIISNETMQNSNITQHGKNLEKEFQLLTLWQSSFNVDNDKILRSEIIITGENIS